MSNTIPKDSVVIIEIDDGPAPLIPLDFEDDELDELADDTLRNLTPGDDRDIYETQVPDFTFVDTVVDDFKVRPGETVELLDGDFLRIVYIVRVPSTDSSQPFTTGFKGILMRRFKHVHDMLPKKLNELCMVLKAPIGSKDVTAHNCLVTREQHEVVCRRNVVITNAMFPLHSFREGDVSPSLREVIYDADSRKRKVYWKPNEVEETGKLVCRFRYTEEYDISRGKVVAESLMRVTEADCDAGKGVEDIRLRLTWTNDDLDSLKQRQAKVDLNLARDSDSEQTPMCGLGKRRREDTVVIDLTNEPDTESSRRRRGSRMVQTHVQRYGSSPVTVSESSSSPTLGASGRMRDLNLGASRSLTSSSMSPCARTSNRSHSSTSSSPATTIDLEPGIAPEPYTYGDICCGAGGTAMGAAMAGFKVQFGVDNWAPAIETFELNFGNGIEKDLNTFCIMETARLTGGDIVTVLHISFPCQAHSHLNQGTNPERDLENIATGYSVDLLLKKHKPRAVTFEQTPGILTKRGGVHYRALVNQLTSAGYSLRWRVMNLAEHGNAQARKRLIIIASCPGEPVPQLPTPTHGQASGLRPLTTIHQALQPLTTFVIRDTPEHMKQFTPKSQHSYNRHVPLRGLITTSGGDSDLHPTGTRSFNVQELALLQGFSIGHQFARATKTDLRKMIGNAVPTVFAEQLFTQIRKSLEESDRVGALWDGLVKLDE